MNPKGKAKELICKYNELLEQTTVSSLSVLPKLCATIAVQELIEQSKDANFGGFELYWKSVLTEIDLL